MPVFSIELWTHSAQRAPLQAAYGGDYQHSSLGTWCQGKIQNQSTPALCISLLKNPSPPFPSQKEDHYPSVPGSVGFHRPPHLRSDGPSQGLLPFYVIGDHRGQHWPGPAPHPHTLCRSGRLLHSPNKPHHQPYQVRLAHKPYTSP